MRQISAKELVHERLAEKFRPALSDYDTQRRVQTLIDDLLTPDRVRGKRCLDVGCGLGFFSCRLTELGAIVTACDIGPNLVRQTTELCHCDGAIADALELSRQFGPECFDIVVSSECIEHTPSPGIALLEMGRVLKKGGWIALSTPNLIWLPVVRAATLLKLRPFDGLERFSTFASIRKALTEAGVTVVQERGLHLWPFQLPFHGASRWVDQNLQSARGAMINLCVLGRKL